MTSIIYERCRYVMMDEERAIHERIYGASDELPPNFKQVSEEEFVKYRAFQGSRHYRLEEFRSPYGCHMKSFETKERANDFYYYNVTLHIGGAKGYAIQYSSNKTIVEFFLFDATEQWQKWFNSLGIVEDTGWNMNSWSSNPIRGIRDYSRTVQFDRELSDVELKYVRLYMELIKCPGWTGVIVSKNPYASMTYNYKTTYDSSD